MDRHWGEIPLRCHVGSSAAGSGSGVGVGVGSGVGVGVGSGVGVGAGAAQPLIKGIAMAMAATKLTPTISFSNPFFFT